MFFNPFPHAIGLDIGDLSIKMVQLSKRRKRQKQAAFNLIVAKSTRLPHGLIVGGILEKPEAVQKYLIHLLKKRTKAEKFYGTPWVVASVPDSQGFLKLIQIEKNFDDIIDEDIVIAAQKHVPFAANDYYLDWQIVPNSKLAEEHSNILIASIPKKIVDMYTSLLESVGLAVVALELGALSVARSMITADKQYIGQGRAILDINEAWSALTIYDNDHIQFSKSLSYSGEKLTTALAQKLHLSYDEAEIKKKSQGLEYSRDISWPILAEATDQLVMEIKQTVDFYYSHFQNTNKITHITMCGGGSALKGLDKILTEKLKIESAPGHVWKNLFSPKPVNVDEKQSLKFAKAVGLAIRAANNPFFDDNYI